MTDSILSLISRFTGLSIAVIGDVILDEYLIGRANRLSREAPVPVLEFEERRVIAGGAANPAANIVALGGAAEMIGVVGADAEALTLRQVLDKKGITWRGLIEDRTRSTTVKTRIMAQMGLRFPQQVARIDRVARDPIAGDVETRVYEAISQAAGVSACLFSDYGSGLITEGVIAHARQLASTNGVLLTADAQAHLSKYTGFGVVKCNADDAAAAVGHGLHSDSEFATAAETLRDRLQLTRGMVITRGGAGSTIAETNGTVTHVAAPRVVDVFDTVGAGDTHIAILTLALAVGGTLTQAVTLANAGSSIVVRHVGNYAPSQAELKQSLTAEGEEKP